LEASASLASYRPAHCRDAFLGLAKTCAKLGLSFWDYLGDRLAIPGQRVIPYLPDLIRSRCQSA